LPPLLFEAMMSIRYEEFRSVARPALRLATLGVVIATVVGGVLLSLAGLAVASAFLFAALIAPTDTATVLEIFRRVRVPRKLSALMDTEASFNDATGIAVFTIILTGLGVSGEGLVTAAVSFLRVIAGGVLVGLLVSFLAHVVARLGRDSLSQTMLTITTVYGSYTASTALGVSGLVAVAVAGLYYGNATMKSWLKPATRRSVRGFWRVAAFIANSLAFLYIGLSTNLTVLVADLFPIIVGFVAVTASRFASVYPLLGTSRVDGEPVPRSWENVAMLGGMRGALSIVLAATLPSTVQQKDLIVSMVLGVCFLSLTLQGTLLTSYARRRFPKREAPRVSPESPGIRPAS
jgi:Na+:H+ antiporter